MMLPRFQFEAPATLGEVERLLAQSGREAVVLAGGTDLLVKMKWGQLRPRLLLSLCRVSDLARLESSDQGGLILGPMCTMAQLAQSPLLTSQTPFAGLGEGAASVGGPIIRNRATVGGNIINARPCADSVPPLMALGARLLLERGGGERRTVELDGFISGPGETGIADDEVLAGIEVPAPAGPAGSSYLKITRRATMEVTLVGAAANVVLDPEGVKVTQARVVLTSVAPVLLRVPGAEEALQGRAPDEAALREAGEAARQAATPIDDHRAPAFYRSEMVAVSVRRALAASVARARGTLKGGPR
jgi:carbon-monoxide dehydrogenase medium subunit